MTTVNVATQRKSLYIKEVAKLVGVTTKTVRHYHKIGLLPEPERTESDYRLYSGWDLWRLRTICELRRLGLSLERIRTVLEQYFYDKFVLDGIRLAEGIVKR